MRRCLLAATGIALMIVPVMIVPGSAATASGGQASRTTACLDFTCVKPGSKYDVPEARGPLPSVRDVDQLLRQTTAGFYRVEGGGWVAYLAPFGQSQLMPPSVRGLPEVRSLRRSGQFERGTVVIVGPRTSIFEEPSPLAPVPFHLLSVGGFGCSERHFCLYGGTNFSLGRRGFSSSVLQEDVWINLGEFQFNDEAESMRNRRHRRSRLAEHINGGGTRYCANPTSVDGTFSNNDIGNNEASSFMLTTNPDNCAQPQFGE